MSIKEDVIKFYRIEHEDTRRSLWYKPNGAYEPFIEKLTEGKAKQLPMDFSTDYYDFGTTWYSALTDVESAHIWFNDLKLLNKLNYLCGQHFNWIPSEEEIKNNKDAKEYVVKEFGNMYKEKLLV